MTRRRVLTVALAVALVGCASSSRRAELDPAPNATDSPTSAATAIAPTADIEVDVRTDVELGPISPLIRGLSGGADRDYLGDVGATVNSWGGTPSTRFNYEIGHAWNAARDWEYRNTNYGRTGDDAAAFVDESAAGGAAVRLAVPTLGWIAKNDDDTTCSFPSDDGCAGAGDANCESPGPLADPTLANMPSTPEMVQAWVERLVVDGGRDVDFIAMDNEPELWGHNHYDVHPACTTYEEVLDKYLLYANAVRDVVPDAKLLGPVACCWFDYWGIAPGPSDGGNDDYLTWFLHRVREHDEACGRRTLDLLDVHYYPQTGVYNDDADPETAAKRLRSTRSLWDAGYVDESWIAAHIRFIPRMQETIAAAYPGTGLAISEWNFGADGTMNGALAVADVLGIYGREGVDVANYWRRPEPRSPGYYAFKMFGNYDDRGSSFAGTAVEARSSDVSRLGSYAAVDPTDGRLKAVLVNKLPDATLSTRVDLNGWKGSSAARLHRYSEAAVMEIVHEDLAVGADALDLELPPYSITLIELEPA